MTISLSSMYMERCFPEPKDEPLRPAEKTAKTERNNPAETEGRKTAASQGDPEPMAFAQIFQAAIDIESA